ncbi:hypothetical protein Slin14017_G055930 [Septoria linicola]|nr:hypothetical protein Slin14017_G055930 [Septoria linicola]
MALDDEVECMLLTRLPGEIRTTVYEYVLTFERPLKLRQIVAGSKNTGILRANQQIYAEALPVLYDVNQIMCTRNDFCHHTDADLQTPMRKDKVRNLLVKNFSQSIKCSSYSGGNNMFLAGCCEVCQPTAIGFLQALSALPKLKSVVVDYHDHASEFAYMKDVIRRDGTLETLRQHRSLTCTGMAQYRLHGTSVPPSLAVTFEDGAFHKIWNVLSNLQRDLSVFGVASEDKLLQQLRDDFDRDLPDKLYFLHCARRSILFTAFFENADRLWRELDQAIDSGGDTAGVLEALYDEVSKLMRRQTRAEASMLLNLMRNEEGRMMEVLRMS